MIWQFSCDVHRHIKFLFLESNYARRKRSMTLYNFFPSESVRMIKLNIRWPKLRATMIKTMPTEFWTNVLLIQYKWRPFRHVAWFNLIFYHYEMQAVDSVDDMQMHSPFLVSCAVRCDYVYLYNVRFPLRFYVHLFTKNLSQNIIAMHLLAITFLFLSTTVCNVQYFSLSLQNFAWLIWFSFIWDIFKNIHLQM